MFRKIIFAVLVLVSISGVPPVKAEGENPNPASAEIAGAGDRIVATINGQPIKASELNAHMAATKLPGEDALEDLIDLRLLRILATANKVTVPEGTWSKEERIDIEYALAQALNIDIPPTRIILVVDHAWLKDAEDEKLRTAGRLLIERMRTLVAAGATIPEVFNQLQVDGSSWHIGDHEEYLTISLPDETHNLPAGSLSPIIPADGGLHLFKIFKRTVERPTVDEVRNPLLFRIRLDFEIERPETPVQ